MSFLKLRCTNCRGHRLQCMLTISDITDNRSITRVSVSSCEVQRSSRYVFYNIHTHVLTNAEPIIGDHWVYESGESDIGKEILAVYIWEDGDSQNINGVGLWGRRLNCNQR